LSLHGIPAMIKEEVVRGEERAHSLRSLNLPNRTLSTQSSPDLAVHGPLILHPEEIPDHWLRRLAYKISVWRHFEFAMGLVILANALSMGIQADSDLYSDDVKQVIYILDHGFLITFTVELAIMLLGSGWKFLATGWGKFDFVIVGMGIISQWIVTPISNSGFGLDTSGDSSTANNLQLLLILRVARLLKLARAVRLMSQFRLLWKLVRGLWSAVEALMWAVVLATVMIYSFAIAGVEILANQDWNEAEEELVEIHFGTVSKSMLTLIQIMTLDSWAAIARPMATKYPYVIVYFVLFIGLCSIVLLNLVTAIIVETSMDGASKDREAEQRWKGEELAKKCEKLSTLIDKSDQDDDHKVSRGELVLAYEQMDDVRMIVDEICGIQDLLRLFDLVESESPGTLSKEELNMAYSEFRDDPIKFICFESHKACKKTLQSMTSTLQAVDNMEHKISEAYAAVGLHEEAAGGGPDKHREADHKAGHSSRSGDVAAGSPQDSKVALAAHTRHSWTQTEAALRALAKVLIRVCYQLGVTVEEVLEDLGDAAQSGPLAGVLGAIPEPRSQSLRALGAPQASWACGAPACVSAPCKG